MANTSYSASPDIEIRPANLADSHAIYDLCVSSIKVGAAEHYSPPQIDAWTGRITEAGFAAKIGHAVFLVAVTPGRTIAGFATLNRSSREVEYVYVHPSYFGSGLGRRLIEAVEAEARRGKIRKLRLIGSLNALGFYEHLGFRAERTIVRTIQGIDLPCVSMSKRL